MHITESDSVIRNNILMTAPVDDELVILSLATNNYLALDPIGRRIWDLIETPSNVDDLCSRLSREYNASKEQVSADVMQFLTELENEGIIHVVSSRLA